MHTRAVLAAPGGGARRHVAVAGILGVKAAVHDDAALRRAVPAAVEFRQLAGALVLLIGLRRIEGLDGIAEVGLEAALRRQLRRLLGEEIHVGKAGGAAGEHLQQGQSRSGADVRRRHAALHGKDAVKQPFLQGQIGAHAPQQRHGGVGMGVHQSGQQQLAGHVLFTVEDPFGTGISHVGEERAVNGHEAVFYHAVRRVDPGVFQQCGHVLTSLRAPFSDRR